MHFYSMLLPFYSHSLYPYGYSFLVERHYNFNTYSLSNECAILHQSSHLVPSSYTYILPDKAFLLSSPIVDPP